MDSQKTFASGINNRITDGTTQAERDQAEQARQAKQEERDERYRHPADASAKYSLRDGQQSAASKASPGAGTTIPSLRAAARRGGDVVDVAEQSVGMTTPGAARASGAASPPAGSLSAVQAMRAKFDAVAASPLSSPSGSYTVIHVGNQTTQQQQPP